MQTKLKSVVKVDSYVDAIVIRNALERSTGEYHDICVYCNINDQPQIVTNPSRVEAMQYSDAQWYVAATQDRKEALSTILENHV